jgi:hypothetical protein
MLDSRLSLFKDSLEARTPPPPILPSDDDSTERREEEGWGEDGCSVTAGNSMSK